MQRQRDELVPVAEVIADLSGPVQALREASPQARHHFTRFDQVNQLVSASEADASLGFMARMMALCSLPRTNPGNRKQYKRVNGPFTLVHGRRCADNKLPLWQHCRGSYLPGSATEAVRTQSREISLGPFALRSSCGTLGMDSIEAEAPRGGPDAAPQSNEAALWLQRRS